MTATNDNLNCIKNLIQMMCCDGAIDEKEKAFLSRAATQLQVRVDNWNQLLKEVLADEVPLYPVQNRDKAIATLKSLIVMSKADGRVDSKEKKLAVGFAKSIGIDKAQWQAILKDIDLENLFEPFIRTAGSVIAIRDHFDKLDDFLSVAKENGAVVQTTGLQEFLATEASETIVCFHAAEEKEVTLTQCRMLLEKCGDKLACVLTRYQGHQVQYLLEIGLKKCIIEPVYARDITELFKKSL